MVQKSSFKNHSAHYLKSKMKKKKKIIGLFTNCKPSKQEDAPRSGTKVKTQHLKQWPQQPAGPADQVRKYNIDSFKK